MNIYFEIFKVLAIAITLIPKICLADEIKMLTITTWFRIGENDKGKSQYTETKGSPIIIREDGSGDFLFMPSFISSDIAKGTFIGKVGLEAILHETKPYMSVETPDDDVFFYIATGLIQRQVDKSGNIFDVASLPTIAPIGDHKASPPQSGYIRIKDSAIIMEIMQIAQRNLYTNNPAVARKYLVDHPPYPGIPEPPTIEQIKKFTENYLITSNAHVSEKNSKKNTILHKQAQTILMQDTTEQPTTILPKEATRSNCAPLSGNYSILYLMLLAILLSIIAIVVYLIRKKNKNRPQS